MWARGLASRSVVDMHSSHHVIFDTCQAEVQHKTIHDIPHFDYSSDSQRSVVVGICGHLSRQERRGGASQAADDSTGNSRRAGVMDYQCMPNEKLFSEPKVDGETAIDHSAGICSEIWRCPGVRGRKWLPKMAPDQSSCITRDSTMNVDRVVSIGNPTGSQHIKLVTSIHRCANRNTAGNVVRASITRIAIEHIYQCHHLACSLQEQRAQQPQLHFSTRNFTKDL